jgi:hypothetical protein
MDMIKILRDQILFLSAFILIFGLIQTDIYYTQFGLRYQYLNLGYQHILYRGTTLAYFDYRFVAIFILLSGVILLSHLPFSVVLHRVRLRSTVIIYSAFVVIASAGAYLSFQSGVDLAVADMYPASTTLRQLSGFHSETR